MMLLFRPHRDFYDEVVRPVKPEGGGVDDFWLAIHKEYRRWREGEIDDLARPFYHRSPPTDHPPAPQSREWWACETFMRLRNMDLVMARHTSLARRVPDMALGLPIVEEHAMHDDDESPRGGAKNDRHSHEFTDSDEHESERADACDESDSDRGVAKKPFPADKIHLCSILTGVASAGDALRFQEGVVPRSAEALYTYGFAARARDCLWGCSNDLPNLAPSEGTEHAVSSADACLHAVQQRKFFSEVDASVAEPQLVHSIPGPISEERKWQSLLDPIIDTTIVSPTIVMEVAFFLIQTTLLRIPEVGTINVKQARALLHFACWIQDSMIQEWGLLTKEVKPCPPLRLVTIGPAGTGKTTVLRLAEALATKFFGPDSVMKCAPTNTAARLLGGDTIHALCKLPPGPITGERGHMSQNVLRRHRFRWQSARLCAIDEFSMLGLDDFYRADIRTRQAKRDNENAFGGIGVSLSGDFMQLPPVDKPSCATPLSVDGKFKNETGRRPSQKPPAVRKESDRICMHRERYRFVYVHLLVVILMC